MGEDWGDAASRLAALREVRKKMSSLRYANPWPQVSLRRIPREVRK